MNRKGSKLKKRGCQRKEGLEKKLPSWKMTGRRKRKRTDTLGNKFWIV